MEQNRRAMMDGKRVGAPIRREFEPGINVVTLKSQGDWFRPNAGPRRAVESPEQVPEVSEQLAVEDPEQLAVRETVKLFQKSLEIAKGYIDNLDGLEFRAKVENPFKHEAELMIGLLVEHLNRMDNLRIDGLPRQYQAMERQLRAEGDIQAGNIVSKHDYRTARRTEAMNKGVGEARTTSGRVGIEGLTVSQVLMNVSGMLDEMSTQYVETSVKFKYASDQVKSNVANGDTSHEARRDEGLLNDYKLDYGALRYQIVTSMVVPLLETRPVKIRDQKMSDLLLADDADIPPIDRPYIKAERKLHELGKKVIVYLENQQRKAGQAEQRTPGSTPSAEGEGTEIESSAKITHLDMLEFFDLVELIVQKRMHYSAFGAFDTAFTPIDRAQEAVNRTRDANVQDTENMNTELALARSKIDAEIDKLHDQRNAIQDVLRDGANSLRKKHKSIETAFNKLCKKEPLLAGHMKAQSDDGDDVSDIEALIATKRLQLIKELESCAPGAGDEEMLTIILQIVAGSQARVDSIAVTDGVPEKVVNKRIAARGKARGEVPSRSSGKPQRALGRIGLWGKGNRQ